MVNKFLLVVPCNGKILLFRFLADYRDLCSWINDMKAVISADELAKDVAGAEALLESHQEHRVSDSLEVIIVPMSFFFRQLYCVQLNSS